MAKTAQDYPVSFGYGAQDGYYYGPKGIVGPYHRGNDRYTPTGTPVVIEGVTIGKTGATGLVSGPHLHTQAGTDIGCQNTINPTTLEFDPGTVVASGTGNQWGKYITIKVGSKYITYCHLSQINVRKGQVIKKGKSNVTNNDKLLLLLNPKYYASQHKDLARNGVKTTAQLQNHWLKFGSRENRKPNPKFNAAQYLANYGDLRRAYGSKGYLRANLHYINNGIKEGRSGAKPVAPQVVNKVVDKTKDFKDKLIAWIGKN